MNTVFLHIFSNFSAKIVFFENKTEILSLLSSESLSEDISLKIEDFSNLKVFIYPIENNNLLPYSVEIVKEDNILKSNNSFSSLFSLPENNYILILKPIATKQNNFEANQLEIDGKTIKKLNFLNDLRGRGKVETFSVSKNKLLCEDAYFVYSNTFNKNPSSDLILLDFFQSVVAKDFKTASSLLSTNLLGVLNKDAINEFFGTFTDCKLVNYYSAPAVVLIYETEAKVFGCQILENKIADIYEINWHLRFVGLHLMCEKEFAI